MSRRLQDFGHRSSAYERPGKKWICGHAAEDRPCRLGPDASGRCRAGAMCAPVRRGDVWTCTRPGGPCEEGPLPDGRCCRSVPPCVPRRSWSSLQRRLATWVAVLALGLLALGLDEDARPGFVEPGERARPHRLIQSCSSCHRGWDEGPGGWIAAATRRIPPVPDESCLGCHQVGTAPSRAHGLSDAVLDRLRADDPTARWLLAEARQALRGDESPHRSPRCATCHAGHPGPEGAAIPDARCQICHEQTFRSFASGHPEFGTYPSTEATAIVFDHRGHFERHFAEAAVAALAPGSCEDCHRIDAAGLRMAVRPFASTCGSCHLPQLDGSGRPAGTKAIEVLNVPGLDSRTLEEAGLEIGDWPWLAEDEPTAFLSLLLAARDPDLAGLPSRLDLLDLRDSEPEDLREAARFAWAVKATYADLRAGGTALVAERLEERLGPLSPDRRADLLQGLPAATLSRALDEWFPNLDAELAAFESGRIPLEPRPATPRTPKTPPAPPEAADSGDDAGSDLLLGEGDDDLLGESEDDLLLDDPGDDLLGGESDDLLLGEGDDDLLAGSGDDLLLDDSGDDLLGDDDLLAGGSAASSDPSGGASDEEAPGAGLREPVDPERWARFGGWFATDTALFYRPARHPDAFLTAWIDLAAARSDLPVVAELFDDAIDPKAPGACGKCHSVDATGERPRVRWEPTAPKKGRSAFTRFPHSDHFTVSTGLNRCEACHRLREGADVLATWQDRDPATFVPAFEPAPKSLCASCHRANRVGESCTSCHLYHVGTRPDTSGSLSLLAPVRSAPDAGPSETADLDPDRTPDAVRVAVSRGP